MTTAAPAVRRGRKFDQVLDGARDVFMRDGFEGASVDEIARAAGVSKATLYSYFSDKRLLFMEVARAECRRQADAAVEMIDEAAPVAEVLRTAGHHILSITLSDFGLRMFRTCLAEVERFPEFGRNWYESGPALARARVSEFLEHACARGDLAIDDIPLAADQFVELCKADVFLRVVSGVGPRPGRAALDRVVDGAVATFLARYGA
ncbi:MAG: TetR/AcrR family transcriptional regulator [Rhodobacteraceae bacterium]|nr:TetR/AcrR family transcriptional regulator [Paracoccaceae bacterium]